MGIDAILHAENWARVPFHFWSFTFFVFGCLIGSFLNVCIHRLPLEQSIVSPPSHCPHCNYSIPWYLNIPLVTWVYLGGKCANCGAKISARYFIVELLTGLIFLSCWLAFGHQSALVALVYCVFLSGLIVAAFIDFEHYIIPDEITLGGTVVGFLCSALVPALHHATRVGPSLRESFLGIVVGAGLIYGVLRAGKLVFGRQKFKLDSPSKITFTETALVLPDQEILYEEVFYRKSDVILVDASKVEMADRCYRDVTVRLSPTKLRVGEEEFDPEAVPCLEAMTENLVLPREAMGLGDVKFMAAIGAFLGWQAVLFTLAVGAMIGSIFGLSMIASRKMTPSTRLYFGPWLALAAAIWIFDGPALVKWYQHFVAKIMGIG